MHEGAWNRGARYASTHWTNHRMSFLGGTIFNWAKARASQLLLVLTSSHDLSVPFLLSAASTLLSNRLIAEFCHMSQQNTIASYQQLSLPVFSFSALVLVSLATSRASSQQPQQEHQIWRVWAAMSCCRCEIFPDVKWRRRKGSKNSRLDNAVELSASALNTVQQRSEMKWL